MRPRIELGTIVRGYRQLRGLSQSGLAARAGCSRTLIWAIETNRYIPDDDLLRRLAEALGVPLEELVWGKRLAKVIGA